MYCKHYLNVHTYCLTVNLRPCEQVPIMKSAEIKPAKIKHFTVFNVALTYQIMVYCDGVTKENMRKPSKEDREVATKNKHN